MFPASLLLSARGEKLNYIRSGKMQPSVQVFFSTAFPYSHYFAMLFVARPRHRLWAIACCGNCCFFFFLLLPPVLVVGLHCGRLGLCNASLIASAEQSKSSAVATTVIAAFGQVWVWKWCGNFAIPQPLLVAF